ncbi:hypothetical protein WR25_02300 [Diploscapter pachys]|uniref:F-box domain-containing protein n=1 Tax=Diploscapter pachys TaxID=2018661 RepID=A0A2A2J6Z9_9BILA|nr:hypothetical protein WR25_02300 [Diploscapter pachys]
MPRRTPNGGGDKFDRRFSLQHQIPQYATANGGLHETVDDLTDATLRPGTVNVAKRTQIGERSRESHENTAAPPRLTKSAPRHFFRNSPVHRLTHMANTVVFELNKATLKLKRTFSPGSRQDAIPLGAISERVSPEHKKSATSLMRGDQGRESERRQLCAELSSFALFPLVGALSPSRFSAPNLLFTFTLRASNRTFTDLPDNIMLKILNYLDVQSIYNASHANSALRRVAIKYRDQIKIKEAYSYEISIAFNTSKQRSDVRALKKKRSLKDPVFEGDNINHVLPQMAKTVCKIIFHHNTCLAEWISELRDLFNEGRLVPSAFVFTGGTFTKGNQPGGCDLRGLSESDFLRFISQFYPYIKEVQLATSKLFRATCSPPRLLGLVSLVSSFELIYERPALRFYFDDLKQIIAIWRHNPLSRSCSIYIRRPQGSSLQSWEELGGTTVESRQLDPDPEFRMLSPQNSMAESFLDETGATLLNESFSSQQPAVELIDRVIVSHAFVPDTQLRCYFH